MQNQDADPALLYQSVRKLQRELNISDDTIARKLGISAYAYEILTSARSAKGLSPEKRRQLPSILGFDTEQELIDKASTIKTISSAGIWAGVLDWQGT